MHYAILCLQATGADKIIGDPGFKITSGSGDEFVSVTFIMNGSGDKPELNLIGEVKGAVHSFTIPDEIAKGEEAICTITIKKYWLMQFYNSCLTPHAVQY